MKKKVFILPLVLLILLGGYVVYFLLTQDWNGNDNQEYTNDKHGYGFQYSADWNMMGDSEADILMFYNSENPPGDGGLPNGIKVEVMALENYDDLSLKEWVDNLNQVEEEALREETRVGNLNAIRRVTTSRFENSGSPIGIYLAKENNIFMISYLGSEPSYSQEMKNFELLLKTFNFNK